MDKSIEKIYDYNDAQGNLLFQVVRFYPKTFLQRRPFQGNYAWGLTEGWYEQDSQSGDYRKVAEQTVRSIKIDAIEPILYHLPELLKGIQNKVTIYVPEGEKDVDNLISLGFCATTCPMGAGKWRSDYTDTLRGCVAVVVIADKDKPGRTHAQVVANELYSAGISVKVMEMPDINDASIKDVSDWLNAGGTREGFIELVKSCPEWTPTQQDSESSVESESQKLINLYGEPYYLNKKGEATAINQLFWAGLHQAENIQLFEPDESEFYRYNPETGLYSVISRDIIKQDISARILEISRHQKLPSLERKRTNSNLNDIVAQLKGISEKKNAFRRGNKFVHLANCMIVFKDDGTADQCSFSLKFYSRNQSPIAFDPKAKCERFLNELLSPAVTKDDLILLQKYMGICLLGDNLIQKLVILDGLENRGKSVLSLIIQKLVGEENTTELRTEHCNERFEIFRYLKKTLLTSRDVPANFLNMRGANTVKSLVGGENFTAEQKGTHSEFKVQGNFCIVITSNSRLRVRIEGDVGAWRRRLAVVRYKAPAPRKNIPHFENVLIQEEGSGILNFALEGVKMVLDDIRNYGKLYMTEAQQKIVDDLLAESASLRQFLTENIIRSYGSDITTQEITENYASYCPDHGWTPLPITEIESQLKELMLELFQTAQSHSIKRSDGKSVRGYRGLRLKIKEEPYVAPLEE